MTVPPACDLSLLLETLSSFLFHTAMCKQNHFSKPKEVCDAAEGRGRGHHSSGEAGSRLFPPANKCTRGSICSKTCAVSAGQRGQACVPCRALYSAALSMFSTILSLSVHGAPGTAQTSLQTSPVGLHVSVTAQGTRFPGDYFPVELESP